MVTLVTRRAPIVVDVCMYCEMFERRLSFSFMARRLA